MAIDVWSRKLASGSACTQGTALNGAIGCPAWRRPSRRCGRISSSMANCVCLTTAADPTLGPFTPRCASGDQTPLEWLFSPSTCYSSTMSISGRCRCPNASEIWPVCATRPAKRCRACSWSNAFRKAPRCLNEAAIMGSRELWAR